MSPSTPHGCDDVSQPRLTAGLEQLPITVLMNAGSGSDDKSSSRTMIDTVLRETGRDVEIRLAHRPRDMMALAQKAAEARPGILVAAGGDGTLNAVATAAYTRRLPFAVIPLGTFNYFARDMGIPLDAAAAARVVAEGSLRSIPIGRVNGRLFLNNASIGLYRHLIEEREQFKRRFGRNRLVALISGIVTLLREHRSYELRMEVDGQASTLSTRTVFFGRNTLQIEQLGLDEAVCVARGELAVLALRDVGRLALLGVAMRSAVARLETAENLYQACASTVQVEWLDTRHNRIRVAVDGELIDCTLPLLVESVPDALQVIVPAQQETGR